MQPLLYQPTRKATIFEETLFRLHRGAIVGLDANLMLDNRRYLRLGMYSCVLGLLGMVLLLGAAVLTLGSQAPRS